VITYVLSGPMTGYPDMNYPLFYEVEKALGEWLYADGGPEAEAHRNGFVIFNPARHFGGDQTREYAEYMAAALRDVMEADVVVLLPGWMASKGADRETSVARWTGKRFLRAVRLQSGNSEEWIFEPVADVELPHAEPSKGRVAFPSTATGRTFEGGAYRDTEDGKLDYEGFLSPLVLHAFAEYMHKHRVQSNGEMRPADNWQKGIPTDVYMKSMWRHFMDVWISHRNVEIERPAQKDALMALLFNVMGYAYELLKEPEGF
jgi:Domain of unknown function (DUF4406)